MTTPVQHFEFYVQHAWRDMFRNGRRTAFALFCIAAGVAAIVALRSLSLMIADSLAGNIASLNHGDLKVDFEDLDSGTPPGTQREDDGRYVFTAETVKRIQAWADANRVKTTYVISNANIPIA